MDMSETMEHSVSSSYGIRKRNGHIVPFDSAKVKSAMEKAMRESGEVYGDLDWIVTSVLYHTSQISNLTVEEVQDAVELCLMRVGLLKTAKAYILYRDSHAKMRQWVPDANAISEYIHPAKYGQYRPELKRRENYAETVARVEEMHIVRFPALEEEIRQAFDYVREKRVLPSMRTLQFAGAAVRQHHVRAYNCSATHANRIGVFGEILYNLLCGCGVGYSVQKHHVAMLPELPKMPKKGVEVVHHPIADSIEGWSAAMLVLFQSSYQGKWAEFGYSQIRVEGSLLRTSGGLAPGHIPLRIAVEHIRAVLLKAGGRRLRPIEVHDCICFLADCVLAGGIRRSSLICLFSHDDDEMVRAKHSDSFRYPWGDDAGLNPQRAMANNSAVIVRSLPDREAVFRKLFKVSMENYGDPGFLVSESTEYACNPCFHPDTRIATDRGLERIGDMIGRPSNRVIVDCRPDAEDGIGTQTGVSVKDSSQVELTRRDAEVFTLTMEHGYKVVCTEYHKFPTTRGRKELREIVEGDTILLQSGEGQFGDWGVYDQGWILGLITGDGVVSRSKQAIGGTQLTTWMRTDAGIEDRASIQTHVPDCIWTGTRDAVRGYLTAMFSTDGIVNVAGQETKQTVSLRLNQSNRPLLEDIQVLLQNFGIVTRLYGVENCELVLSRPNCLVFLDKIGLPGQKETELREAIRLHGEECSPERYISRVQSIVSAGRSDVYCLNQPETHTVIANGVVAAQCAEALGDPALKSASVTDAMRVFYKARNLVDLVAGQNPSGFYFCNLCEVNAAVAMDATELVDAARAAAFIGTLQASYTDFPFLGPITESITRRCALLGVGLTGMCDNPGVAFDPLALEAAAGAVVEENRRVADLIGINPTQRAAVIKPSGTASLVLNCVGSGIHPHHAKRYFRRVTANPGEPVAQLFQRTNPHMVETKPNGDWCITFPVQAPDGAETVKDQPWQLFLDRLRIVYKHWILPGTASRGMAFENSPGLTHNISSTLAAPKKEFGAVEDEVAGMLDRIAAMSFLERMSDKGIPFMPREEVVTADDEVKWQNLIRHYQSVDYNQSYDEMHDRELEAACTGDRCVVDVSIPATRS